MTIPNTNGKTKNVPNHQPTLVQESHLLPLRLFMHVPHHAPSLSVEREKSSFFLRCEREGVLR